MFIFNMNIVVCVWHIFNIHKDSRVNEVTALAGHKSTCCNSFMKKCFFYFEGFGRLFFYAIQKTKEEKEAC